MKKAAALLMLLVMLPSTARSWGWPQHQIIGSIAQSRLSAEAKQGIKDILGGDYNLADIAPCADQISRNDTVCAGIKFKAMPETRNWHYINLPVNEKPTAASIKSHCPGDNCAPMQVKKEVKTIADAGASKQEKLVALVFMLHLVGDIHQPLHCVDDNDGGGNALKLSFMGTTTSLHSMWDHMMFVYSNPVVNNSDPAKAYVSDKMDVAKVVKTIEKNLKDKDTATWTTGDVVVDAVVESQQVAMKVAYPQYADMSGNQLSPEVISGNTEVFTDLIQKSGIRLAYLLNEAFKDGGKPKIIDMTPPAVKTNGTMKLQVP
ncbi:MAG: hypothetical protein GX410_05785 [Elusimicrobia bacterium]|nr:hypothetical protein [Elusimicrobiota bacterium]